MTLPPRPPSFWIGLIAIGMALSGLAGVGRSEEQSAPTLEGVMQGLARSGGVEARFRESRQLTILSEPIESGGMLYFAPPDWLARHVTDPSEAKVIVRDDRVTFQDETGVQTLELDSSEVARAMVGNVIILMRGDLAALRSQYVVGFEVEGDGGLWTLDLEPRDRVVRQLIERLRVNGRRNQLVRMESIETSGDITVTDFSDVEVGVEFSPARRSEVFSIDPAQPGDMTGSLGRGSLRAAPAQ